MAHDEKHTPRFHAIVPAAGVGLRLGASLPKQYLRIGARTLIEWVVDNLLDAAWIEQVVVVVAPGDDRALSLLGTRARLVISPCGGASRRDSVLNGLRLLSDAAPKDWVLVHDAARPGLDPVQLQRLRDGLDGEAVGALLALPIADTVKRADDGDKGRSASTVARGHMWLAQTPQAFRLELLLAALERYPDVTDEACAIEMSGQRPKLIVGSRQNFKVTTLDDLEMMRCLLLAATPTSGS